MGNGAKKHFGKPDGISLGFEDEKLVINDIIEIKSSEKALEHGLDTEQPRRTIESLQSLVNTVNQLLSGKENAAIPPKYNRLSQSENEERNAALNDLRNELAKIKKHYPDLKRIVFSPDMSYTVYLPKNVQTNNYGEDFILNEYGYSIKFARKSSIFNSSDVRKVVDHYAEQHSK